MKTRSSGKTATIGLTCNVPATYMPPEGPVYQASVEEAVDFNLLLYNVFYNKGTKTEIELSEVWKYGVKVKFPESVSFTSSTKDEILNNQSFQFKNVQIQKVCKASDGFFNIVNTNDKETKFGTPRSIKQLVDRPLNLKNAAPKVLWDTYFNELRRAATVESDSIISAYPANVPGSDMNKDGHFFDLDNLQTILLKIMRFYFYGAEGLTSSMKYIGSWLASFCRHFEDKNLWSTFFLFAGAEKFWEIVCSSLNSKLEDLTQQKLKRYVSESLKSGEANSLRGHDCPAIMRHKAIITDPQYLRNNAIDTRVHVQRPGELIIIPPEVYHSGYSTGKNVGQAVNFLTPDSIPLALAAKEYPKVFIKFPIEFLVYDHMYECYNDYVNGKLKLMDTNGSFISVPAPLLISRPKEMKQSDIDQGLDAILAFKIQDGIEYCFVSIQGYKYWEQRKVCEKWCWGRNVNPEKINDSWFSFSGNKPPPYLEMGRIMKRNRDEMGKMSITESLLADIIKKTYPAFGAVIEQLPLRESQQIQNMDESNVVIECNSNREDAVEQFGSLNSSLSFEQDLDEDDFEQNDSATNNISCNDSLSPTMAEVQAPTSPSIVLQLEVNEKKKRHYETEVEVDFGFNDFFDEADVLECQCNDEGTSLVNNPELDVESDTTESCNESVSSKIVVLEPFNALEVDLKKKKPRKKGAGQFYCPFCSATFTRNSSLTPHFNKCNNKINYDNQRQSELASQNPKDIQVSTICLVKVIVKAWTKNNASKQCSKQAISCPFCHSPKSNTSNLKRHLETCRKKKDYDSDLIGSVTK